MVEEKDGAAPAADENKLITERRAKLAQLRQRADGDPGGPAVRAVRVAARAAVLVAVRAAAPFPTTTAAMRSPGSCTRPSARRAANGSTPTRRVSGSAGG